MRFLVDNALSPVVATKLREAGHDATHVRDAALQRATDDIIFEYAQRENRILVSADTDFSVLLARRETPSPSLVLFRGPSPRRPEAQASRLLRLLPSLEEDLTAGSIVVIEHARVRIRRLPLVP